MAAPHASRARPRRRTRIPWPSASARSNRGTVRISHGLDRMEQRGKPAASPLVQWQRRAAPPRNRVHRAPGAAVARRITRYAMETRPPPPRGHAAVHGHGRADPGPRHRRQHRHLQRHRGRPAEAAAVSAVGRARRARPRRARLRHPARRRRAVPVLHLSRGGACSRTSRCGTRHRQRHRAGPAGRSPDAVRHRRRAADPRRAADARAAVLESRRLARRPRDGHPTAGYWRRSSAATRRRSAAR